MVPLERALVNSYRHVDGHAYKQTRQLLFWELETDTLHSLRRSLTRSPPRTDRSRSWIERSMNVRPTIITFAILH